MNIKENISSLIQAMQILQDLDDQEYLESNEISQEEAEEFKKQITEEIKKYKSEIKDYMNVLSKKRQI